MFVRLHRLASAALVALLWILTACGGSTADVQGTTDETVESSNDTEAPASPTSASTSSSTAPASTETIDPIIAPDVVGLTATAAKAALMEVGIDDVRVEEEEYLGNPGQVLDQIPAPGSRVTGTFNLVVSGPMPPVPDFINRPLREARDWFEARGVEVRIETKLTSEVPPDTVLGTTPPPGGDVVEDALIQVSERPFVKSLTELNVVEDECRMRTGDISVDGDVRPRSLYWTGTYYTASCFVEVDLSRDWSSFRGMVGLGDSSESGSSARFEILVDGEPAIEPIVLGIGETEGFDVDVTGALRVRIITTNLTMRERQADWVWVTPEVVGSSSVIDDQG